MSQLRVMRNGKPEWQPEGPAFARVQGHGGSSLGYFSGTVVVKPPRVKLPRQPLSVTRPKGTADAEVVAKGRSAT